MLEGFVFALGACLLWGLVFALPGIIHTFSPLVVTLGRCFIFGLYSFIFFIFRYKRFRSWLKWTIFQKALVFALIANVVHYIALVLGLKYGDKVVTTLILSLNPLAGALCIHYQKPIFKTNLLILSIIGIAIGLFLLQWPLITNFSSWFVISSTLLWGGIALATWTWFIIANGSFVKKHDHIPAQDWVTLIGIATALWMLAFALLFGIYALFIKRVEIFFAYSFGEWERLLIISLLLGIGSSWMAHYLWNQASTKLPLIILSFLTIFETVFGLLYIYLMENRIPTLLDCTAIAVIFFGVGSALYSSQNQKVA